MAVVCAKCGAEIAAGVQFCSVCGTPVNAGAASGSTTGGFTPVNIPGQIPNQATPPPPQPPPQAAAGTPPLPGYTPVAAAPGSPGYAPGPVGYAPPAAAYPAKSGSSAVKIILIVLAILIGLGVLGAGAVGFVAWRVARSFHLNGKNGQITMNTPSGSVTASSEGGFTSDELGTDIYPGAQSVHGGMRMNLPTGSIVSGAFLTPDSKDQVLAFYKSKLGSTASVFDSDTSAMISVKKGGHENIMVTISARPSENNGKTKISIVHTKNGHSS
jgi:hypothetical protein